MKKTLLAFTAVSALAACGRQGNNAETRTNAPKKECVFNVVEVGPRKVVQGIQVRDLLSENPTEVAIHTLSVGPTGNAEKTSESMKLFSKIEGAFGEKILTYRLGKAKVFTNVEFDYSKKTVSLVVNLGEQLLNTTMPFSACK